MQLQKVAALVDSAREGRHHRLRRPLPDGPGNFIRSRW
jgi:hypothetical protein